jgi:predicted O-methyltransferase YrrM
VIVKTTVRADSQSGILAETLRGVLRNALRKREELRYHAIRDAWSATKRFGSRAIENVELRELPAVRDAVVEAYIDDPNRAVLAALCRAVEAKTFFEIGTNRGRTAWSVARNNPQCHVYTLDLPDKAALENVALDIHQSDRNFFAGEWDRGEAFRDTPEAERITVLHGDSATFDFTPFAGQMDVVFVDGAHTYAYVKSDTENALALLAAGGTIVWDDYPAIAGIYHYLNELARTLDRPLYHIYGTRLVFFTGRQLVDRLDAGGQARQFAA